MSSIRSSIQLSLSAGCGLASGDAISMHTMVASDDAISMLAVASRDRALNNMDGGASEIISDTDTIEECTTLWEYKGEVKDGKDGTVVETPVSESDTGSMWDVSSVSELDGWKDVEAVFYVHTNGTSCTTFCGEYGLQCDKASDDAHWQVETLNNWIVGGTSLSTTHCTLLPLSSERSEADSDGKSVQGNEGCDALWDTQVCGCSPVPAPTPGPTTIPISTTEPTTTEPTTTEPTTTEPTTIEPTQAPAKECVKTPTPPTGQDCILVVSKPETNGFIEVTMWDGCKIERQEYDPDEIVMDQCFDGDWKEITLKNTHYTGWTGELSISKDGGLTYQTAKTCDVHAFSQGKCYYMYTDMLFCDCD